MNKKRLLKLADLLEADAKNKKGIKFDLGTWGDTSDNEPVSVSCNTSACAMGLAVVSKAFARAGLFNGSYCQDAIIPQMPSGAMGFNAAEELFGIDSSQSDFLFCIDSYPLGKTEGATGERYVAKRIRDFVAGKVSPPNGEE